MSWQWRKASGGWWMDTDPGPSDRLFHAYGPDDMAACEPGKGLCATCEEPNEGSRFCHRCMDIARRELTG